MHKHIIAKLERGSNLRKSIRGEREIFNAALSNVEFPATNIPYSPAMYSDILFDSRSSVGNASASSKEDNNNDVMDDSSSMRVNKEDNGKEREKLVVTERLNDEASEEENDKTLPFPEQLMNLLSEKRFKEFIDWLPHGQSLLVYDKKKFTETVLPIYFRGTKYTSFTRKLNRWGFKRIRKGIETGAYSNKYFKRDDPILCKQMRCRKKHEIKKKISNPTSEVHHDINPDHKKNVKTVINVLDKTQASVKTNDMNAALPPDMLVRNQSMCPEQHEKMQEINSSVKAHASIDITDMNISPSFRLLNSNQRLCSESYGKMQETKNSFHKAQASSDTTDVNITPTADLFKRNQYNFMKPSPPLLVRNLNMCSEHYEKIQKTANSFHKAQASSDTNDVNIMPTTELFTRNESNFTNIAPSPRFLVRKQNLCSERCAKMQKTENSFYEAEASSDTTDLNITPTAEHFTRNESNFMKLVELKKQQKEIDNILEDITQGASKQIRHPIQPYAYSSEEASVSPKLYRNYASSA